MFFRTARASAAFINELLPAAEQEARDLGDELPGPEHLLLAAAEAGDDSARSALARVGVSASDIRAAIRDLHTGSLAGIGVIVPEALEPQGRGSGPPRGVFRGSGSMRDAFARAAVLSKAERPRGFRSAHVVAAVAEIEHGTAARVLSRLGVDRPALITAVRAVLD